MSRAALLVLALHTGCGDPAVLGSIALRLDEAGILDEIDTLTLDVHDSEGLTCRTDGELEGTPVGEPIVRDLRLTVGEETTVTVSEGERAFVVAGTAAGERVAAGCTIETLRSGQTVAVEISVHRLLHPGECGNDDLEASEQCDDGNTEAGDGCDAACATEEGTFPQGTDAAQVAPVASAGEGGDFAVSWFDTNANTGTFITLGFRDAEGERLTGGAGNDRPVNDQVRGDPNAPAVGSSGAGTIVAWEDYSGVGADVPDVKVHFFGADSLELDGADTLAHEDLEGRQEQPSAAMGASGVSLVVWLDDTLAPPGVQGRAFDADGQPVGADPVELSGGQSVTSASAAATADGFAVAYAGDGIHLRIVDEEGASGDELEMDAPASATAPALAATADGATVLVTWIAAGTVRGQLVEGGAAVGEAFDISTEGTAAEPAVAGGDALFGVVWRAGNDVFGRLVDDAGAPLFNRVQADTTPFAVNRDTDDDQVHPGVAIVGDLMLAVWEDQGARPDEDDSPSGIRFRWFSLLPP